MPTRAPKLEPDTTVQLPLSQLRLYTRNPRKGNVGAIAASLAAHGQYRPIVANIGTHTKRKLEVLSGNHTLKALRQLAEKDPDDARWSTALVHLVDVDEDQAKRIVLAANQTSAKGDYDNTALVGILSDLNDSESGLGAVGFTFEDLSGLEAPPADLGGGDDDDYVDEDQIPDNSSGRGAPVISYSIVFDTLDEKKVWVDFMNHLKRTMPECTVGERIANYIEDLAGSPDEERDEIEGDQDAD